jgi:hypothetical protein
MKITLSSTHAPLCPGWGAAKVEQLEAQATHLIEQRVQLSLLEVTGQHGRGRFDVELEITERLACHGSQDTDDSDLVRGS